MRIFLIGFMGSGKTTWGKQLAEALHLRFIDLDQEIERGEGITINQIFHLHGEDFFRSLESTYLKELSLLDNVVLACGGGTPCYHDNMELLNTRGSTIWLNPSVEVLESRLAADAGVRPLLKGMDAESRRHFITSTLAKRIQFYSKAKLTIDTSTQNLQSLIDAAKSL